MIPEIATATTNVLEYSTECILKTIIPTQRTILYAKKKMHRTNI